jgi:hypothetical protein
MTDTTPADLEKADPDPAPVLAGLQHVPGGYLLAMVVEGGRKGIVLELDAATLGLQPGAVFSVTPASPAAASLGVYALPGESGTVHVGVASAPKGPTVVTVMVTP